MASVQYKSVVIWDASLVDVGFMTSDVSVVVSALAGLAINASKVTTGAPNANAGKFTPGALIQNLVDGTLYINSGSTASPSWTIVDTAAGLALTNGHIFVGNASNLPADVAMSGDVTIANTGATTIGTAKVTGAKLVTTKGYYAVATATNGTNAVNVFGATVPFGATITGIYGIALDGTAGTITIADTAGTVATFAKGTSAGALVGATSLANTTITAGNTLTVVSSSAGNANVVITFTVA